MNKKTLAVIYMSLSALAFSTMNIFIKLSGELPTIQKSFFRNIIAAIVAFIIIKINNEDIKIPKENRFTLLLRSIFGTLGILANFYAVDHLILSDASILSKISPFSTIIFSLLILKEKISLRQTLYIILAFIGVIFVVRPSSLLFKDPSSLIALSGGIFAGVAYTFVRKLGLSNVKGPKIVFYFSLFSSLVVLPILIFNYTPMTLNQFILLILAGISASVGQFMITLSYKLAPAKEVSIYSYLSLIFASLYGFIIFDQTPTYLSIIGYIIIVFSAYLLFLYNKRKK